MEKLEKLLKIGTKVALILPFMLLTQKISLDEAPRRYPYVAYPITIEERLEESRKEMEKKFPENKVIELAKKLVGTKVPKGEDICCWTAVKYIYDKAGVIMNCAYAVTGGEKFNFKNELTNGKYEKVIVGKTIKNGRIIIEPIQRSKCLSNDANKKLDNITKGDILSYLVDGQIGHNAIFMKWLDKKEKTAEILDWGGINSKGEKIYRIYETDLSDDSHPVFYYWKPRNR